MILQPKQDDPCSRPPSAGRHPRKFRLSLLFALLALSTTQALAETSPFETAANLARQIEAKDLVSKTLSEVAMEAREAGQVSMGEELFAEAAEVARTIESTQDRFHAQLLIALSQERAGDGEASSATIETATSEAMLNMPPPDHARLVSVAVQAFFDAGLVESARALNQRVLDPYRRNENLVGMTSLLIEANEIDRAVSTAIKIEDPEEREAELDFLFNLALAEDRVEIAKNAAAALPDGNTAERVRRALALDQALREGSLDTALPDLLADSPDQGIKVALLADLMLAQKRAGAVDEAARTAERAAAMARGIEDEELRAAALEELAPATALAGEIDTTVAIINDLPVQSFERNAAIRMAVARLIEAGAFAKARRLADLFDHPPHRASLYGQIAKGLTRAGEPDAALALIENLEPERERSRTLADMVEILANAGEMASALAVAEGIDDELNAVLAQNELAKAQARAGDLDGAHATAERISIESYQQSALRHIALAEADAGLFERALETVARINHERDRPEAIGHLAAALAAAGRTQEALDAAAQLEDRSARDKARAGIAVAIAQSPRTGQ